LVEADVVLEPTLPGDAGTETQGAPPTEATRAQVRRGGGLDAPCTRAR
jgi:hypothetical protein